MKSETKKILDAAYAASRAGEHEIGNDLIEAYQATILAKLWCVGNGKRWPATEREQESIVNLFLAQDRATESAGDLLVTAVQTLQELHQFDWLPPQWVLERVEALKAARNDRSPNGFGRLHFYDCLYSSGMGMPVQHGTRLFGNANVGDANLTNLQVAGQLAYDSDALLTSWFVSMWPGGSAAPDGYAELLIGKRIIERQRLCVLRERPQGLFASLPVRQNIADHGQLKDPDAFEPQQRLYIHRQGWKWPSR